MRIKIYIFAFILSLFVTLMVRGLFFLTRYQLGMSDSQNLILALISGLTYIVGAQLSHSFSKKVSARKAMIFLLFIQVLTPFLCFIYPSFLGLNVFFSIFSFTNGMTWPFAESYASAGLDRKGASSSIGIYNICWSSALPIAMFLSGPLIAKFASGFLIFVSVGILISITPIFLIPAKPPFREDKEENFIKKSNNEEKIDSIENLLLSSRCSMFFSYCVLQLLNSLLPGRFYELGFSIKVAAAITGLIDLSRIAGFLYMSRTHSWHGNKLSLFLSSPALAAAFALCMFSEKLTHIIIGELILGLFAAISYYSALFYAMHIKNASVDAGGTHESVIGAGFLAGPIVGIFSSKLLLIPLFSSFSIPSLSLILLSALSIPPSILPLFKKKSSTCKNNNKS